MRLRNMNIFNKIQECFQRNFPFFYTIGRRQNIVPNFGGKDILTLSYASFQKPILPTFVRQIPFVDFISESYHFLSVIENVFQE